MHTSLILHINFPYILGINKWPITSYLLYMGSDYFLWVKAFFGFNFASLGTIARNGNICLKSKNINVPAPGDGTQDDYAAPHLGQAEKGAVTCCWVPDVSFEFTPGWVLFLTRETQKPNFNWHRHWVPPPPQPPTL